MLRQSSFSDKLIKNVFDLLARSRRRVEVVENML
jgi:hypothetical protein